MYGVPGLPVTVFLSPSGKTILGENIGAPDRRKLRTILRRLVRRDLDFGGCGWRADDPVQGTWLGGLAFRAGTVTLIQ